MPERMTKKRIEKEIGKALATLRAEIQAIAARGHYAAGLSTEGFAGGYQSALNDVLLVMNGVRPNNSGERYWRNFIEPQ